MKALMYVGQEALEVQEVQDPKGEFIVKVLGCAICGTDLKTVLHGHPFFKPPTILGHEFYGVVESAPESTGYHAGDYVSVAPYGECGHCEACQSGNEENCKNKDYVETGAFCEKIAVPLSFVDRGVYRIEKPDPAFALVEPLACVLKAIEMMDCTKDKKALVIGGGPMGTLIAFTLQDMGVDVQIAEINQLRCKYLNDWGIKAGPVAEEEMKQFDRIFVAVNIKELAEQACRAVKDNGKVHIFAGMPSGTQLSIDAYALHYRKVSVMGCSGFTMGTFKRAFELVSNKPEHYRRLITHTFSLEQGMEAFQLLKSGGAFKVLIEPCKQD